MIIACKAAHLIPLQSHLLPAELFVLKYHNKRPSHLPLLVREKGEEKERKRERERERERERGGERVG